MKKFLLIFLLLGLGSRAQNSREIDSLLQITRSSTNDSVVMDSYNKLRRATYYNDPEASKNYTERYLEMARKRKDSHNIVLAHFFLGNALLLEGAYPKATQNYLVGANYYEKKQDTARLTSVYNSLGAVYEKTENDSLSLHYYTASKRLAQSRKDFRRSGIASVNIGNIYTNRNEPEKAIKFLQEAVNDLDNNPKFISFLNMAKINLGTAYRTNGDLNQAIQIFREVLTQIDTLENPYLHANILEGLSNSYRDQNRDIAALEAGEKAYHIYVENNFLDDQLQMLPDLISTYRKNEKLEEALHLFDTYQAMKDSILVATNNQQITDAIQKYETEKKDAQLQVLTIEKQREKDRNLWLSLLALSGIIVAGIVGFALVKNRRKNKLLAKQKKLLEATVDEKNVLLKETHHRVKNSFQIVSSLLYLQSENIKDKEAQLAMKEAQNRVRSMVLIHQKLYSKDQLVGIDTREYFTDLTNDIFDSHQFEGNAVNYELSVESLVLDIETITPLGLILNEMITNVLKHAFDPIDDQSIMHIRLNKQGKALKLQVEDNGLGMPSEIKESSFGIKLIKALAKKLKAELSFPQQPSKGTLAVLDIHRFNEL